ncbi:MAG: hypothetical protein HY942_03935 [Gammaproteobacteria bacterium]|nr:hypothetical protein [Gammaproteobacteria bacterium]
MATVKKVNYFVTSVPNKPGAAAHALNALRGVNLLVFTGFPSGRGAQLDFVPQNSAAFKAAAKRAKLKLRVKQGGFLIQGGDRAGAIARIMSRLAAAKINVTAIDAVCAGGGRFGAILWVKPKDAARAGKALGAR